MSGLNEQYSLVEDVNEKRFFIERNEDFRRRPNPYAEGLELAGTGTRPEMEELRDELSISRQAI